MLGNRALADEVSVTVNGKTYQCSGTNGGEIKVMCGCEHKQAYSCMFFAMMVKGIDLATGNTVWERKEDSYTYSSLKACHQSALGVIPLTTLRQYAVDVEFTH